MHKIQKFLYFLDSTFAAAIANDPNAAPKQHLAALNFAGSSDTNRCTASNNSGTKVFICCILNDRFLK